MRRLKGLVFGWYHQRNAGDDRFAKCIEMWLHDHDLMFLPHTMSPPMELISQVDYVLIGGGSLGVSVHGVFANMRKWVRKARIPVFGISLTSITHPTMVDQLRAIPESGGMIWTRDSNTANGLPFGDAVVDGPDIAWMYPQSHFVRSDSNAIGLNLRPWSKRPWDPQTWRQALHATGREIVPWPLGFGGKASDDSGLISEVLGRPVCGEYDPTVPSRVGVVVAMRYHAIVFAVQAGVPFVAVSNTHKVDHLVRQIGIPDVTVPMEAAAELPTVVDRACHENATATISMARDRLQERAVSIAATFKHAIEARTTIAPAKSPGLLRRLARTCLVNSIHR